MSRVVFDAAFAGVAPDEAVLAKTKRQSEFVKPIADYLASAVSASRIETGRERAKDWKDTLERADATYGVDPTSSSASGGSKPISARTPAIS